MVAGGEGPQGMRRTVTLGLDVGGTKVAGGLVSDTGRLLLVREHSSLVDGARDPGLTVTLGLARELMAEAASEGLTVDGIGAGFPEYVDLAGRLTSHEVLSWTGQPVELLAQLAPVTVESDVRCAALGEGAQGVARGLMGFAFVIVGTGLSYALVEDGMPRPGARGEAIALGELEVSRHVDATSKSRLERYASGEGMRAVRGPDGPADRWRGRGLRAWSGGDRDAAAIVSSAGQALGEGLATLVRLLDPGAVVIGGGVATALGGWRETVASTYAARLASRPAAPPIRWAELGRDAGIIGAAIAHRRRRALEARA